MKGSATLGALLLLLPVDAAGQADRSQPAATVGETVISVATVDGHCGAPCGRLRDEIRRLKWETLGELVARALLENIDLPAPPAPTPAEIDAFIAARPQDFSGPPERDRAAVRFYLDRERRAAIRAARLAEESQRHPPQYHVQEGAAVLGGGDIDLPLARVNGHTINNGDVETTVALQLYRLRGELARERRRQLDALVDETLWNEEAPSRNLSVAALQRDVRERAAPVTDVDIDRYFETEVRARDPHATKRPDRLRPYLEFQATHAATRAFLDAAAARRGIRINLTEPVPPRLSLQPGAGGWHGPSDARVKVVFLTSYRGATGRAVWDAVRRLVDEPDTAISVRPLLPQWDPEATAVAAAVQCAGQHGKAWELNDALARAPELPAPGEIRRLGEVVGLDGSTLRSCIDRPSVIEAVLEESRTAEALGLDDPPAVLINGLVRAGMQSIEGLRTVVAAARGDAGKKAQ